MSIVETVLVFVGVPVLVYALVALLLVGPGRGHRPRYRPGEAWDYEPVWYIPQARPGAAPAGSGHAVAAGERAPALAGGREALPAGGSASRVAGAPAAERAGGSVQVTTEVAEHPAGERGVSVRTAKGGVHDSW